MAKTKTTVARKSAASTLVALLRGAGKAELEEFDREIAGFDDQIDALKKERSALQQARRLVDCRLNGSRTGASKGGTEQRKERRNQIFKFLTEEGPAQVQAISRATRIPKGSIHAVLNHEWFAKTADGWTAVKAGSNVPAVGLRALRESD